MADMVDMKMTAEEILEEIQEGNSPVSSVGMPNPYPWGLAIRLEDDELEKLGITELPGVGDEYHFQIIAKVTNVAQQLGGGEDGECSVGLQITMMQVLMHESAKEEAGENESPASEAAESLAGKYRG